MSRCILVYSWGFDASVAVAWLRGRCAARFVAGEPHCCSRTASVEYAGIVPDSRWFSSIRDALGGFVRSVRTPKTAPLRLELFKGAHAVVGRARARSSSRRAAGAISVGMLS